MSESQKVQVTLQIAERRRHWTLRMQWSRRKLTTFVWRWQYARPVSAQVLQKCKLCFFIHHEPIFHLRVKSQRYISFFSQIFYVRLKFWAVSFFFQQYLFEPPKFTMNLELKLFLYSYLPIDSFWKQKRTGEKLTSIFWEGKIETFL